MHQSLLATQPLRYLLPLSLLAALCVPPSLEAQPSSLLGGPSSLALFALLRPSLLPNPIHTSLVPVSCRPSSLVLVKQLQFPNPDPYSYPLTRILNQTRTLTQTLLLALPLASLHNSGLAYPASTPTTPQCSPPPIYPQCSPPPIYPRCKPPPIYPQCSPPPIYPRCKPKPGHWNSDSSLQRLQLEP